MDLQDRSPRAPSDSSASYNPALTCLRVVLVLLVIAHHALLAYHPYAPLPADELLTEPRLWAAFPIVDAAKAPGIDLLVGWNDTFLMSLFFLLSGVVAGPSLARKGSSRYFRDRLLRLGLPFLLAAGLLAPLAYLPTYLAAIKRGAPAAGGFLGQWLSLGNWPAGPAWFLWVLLVLGTVAALIYRRAQSAEASLATRFRHLGERPLAFFGVLLGVSAVAFLPLAALLGPLHWASFGPFFIQSARALHYAAYFAIGMGIGVAGLQRGLLDPGGRLVRQWPLWTVGAILSFAFAVGTFLAIMAAWQQGGPSALLSTIGNFSFVLCCATTSLAALAIALRFGQRTGRATASFAANAYGIYLVHYAWVSWLQLLLLDWPTAGLIKAITVVILASLGSWATAALLRRIPGVAKVI